MKRDAMRCIKNKTEISKKVGNRGFRIEKEEKQRILGMMERVIDEALPLQGLSPWSLGFAEEGTYIAS